MGINLRGWLPSRVAVVTGALLLSSIAELSALIRWEGREVYGGMLEGQRVAYREHVPRLAPFGFTLDANELRITNGPVTFIFTDIVDGHPLQLGAAEVPPFENDRLEEVVLRTPYGSVIYREREITDATPEGRYVRELFAKADCLYNLSRADIWMLDLQERRAAAQQPESRPAP